MNQNVTAALNDQDPERRRATCRNTDVLDDMNRVADYVAQLRFGTVYNFDARGRVNIGQLGTTSDAMCLIEWFYLLPGPKKVDAYTNSADGYAYVRVISGDFPQEIDVWTAFESPEACAIVAACKQPSVHLLRHLQIAGVR